ncbi:ABC transporter ATP-binding protein [Pelodictyon phaeoclathratiforme]|jgi:branched-chain amino acid transport system ATP-binding protein|uniref:ABC transporter related n=1 Tax=Pelodictyon phaeoclathratiforme (strain DSM 5477 / BU-1) TaxID=324925 RepID=B4SCW9_PELPB|nr:ABC transporter ATP-binding protein [Pelodictyon phaeoclathratiforme]ACF42803.1 ABC transporter related [Pelodictyon phaeoclathratiforme BU-1]MBV5327944.1 ABC transporter ATP-binding protein [Chlorobium sp.]
MLKVENLRAGYSGDDAVRGISIEVAERSCVALVGANGAGKSTLVKSVCGLLTPRGGKVLFGGEEIMGLPASQVARRGLSLCPEGRRLFAPLSVEENLLLGAYPRLPSFGPFRRAASGDLQRIYEMFPRLGERRSQQAGSLSGGEQQMLAIGRLLMARPRLMILDEPSMGLAPMLVKEVFLAISSLRASGMTILLSEQFAKSALAVSDRAYIIEQGRVVLEGSSAALAKDPAVMAAYLG